MLRQGQDFRFDIQRLFKDFEECVYVHRKNLVELIEALTAIGKKLSVMEHLQKATFLLQFCSLTRSHIPFIAEVNEELTAFTLLMRHSFPIQLTSSVSVGVQDTRLANWPK
jgi:hypothetical protein